MSRVLIVWSINYKVESGFGKVNQLINWRKNALQPQCAYSVQKDSFLRNYSTNFQPRLFITNQVVRKYSLRGEHVMVCAPWEGAQYSYLARKKENKSGPYDDRHPIKRIKSLPHISICQEGRVSTSVPSDGVNKSAGVLLTSWYS